MGAQIIKSLVFFVFFLLFGYTWLAAQSGSVSAKIRDAKGYAFYYCIKKHYARYDSACAVKSKDYSGAYFVQQSSLSAENINKIAAFVDANYPRYYPGSPAENPGGNMVCLGCWRLYESPGFSNYLQKIFRYKKVKKRRKRN
jgi:hypothetical protein